MKITNIQIVDT